MTDKETLLKPKSDLYLGRNSKIQISSQSSQISGLTRSASAGSIRVSPGRRISEDSAGMRKQAVENALSKSGERAIALSSIITSISPLVECANNDGMQSAESSDTEAPAIKDKKPKSIRITTDFLKGYTDSQRAQIIKLLNIVGSKKSGKFKVKSDNESLQKAISRNFKDILEISISLNWIGIPPLSRSDKSYDLLVIVLAGSDEYLPFQSSVFNLVQASKITYSRSIILFDSAHHNAATQIMSDFSHFLKSIESCEFQYASACNPLISKICDDEVLRGDAKSILIVSAYDYIDLLKRHINKHPNTVIDLYCASQIQDVVPSSTLLQRLITDELKLNKKVSHRGI